MSSDIDLAALFGPSADRTIDGAARRTAPVAELVLSTGARYAFDRPVVIGRRDTATTNADRRHGPHRLDVDHPMLSRQHACVSPVGRRASIVDLGSTNGTVVVAPKRAPIVCVAGRLVLVEVGWRIELAGAIWAVVEPQPNAGQPDGADGLQP